MENRRWITAGLLALTITSMSAGVFAEDVTADRLLNAASSEEAGNWLMVHRDYNSDRYSPLNQITADNVSGLKLAFSVPIGGMEPNSGGVGTLEGTPLADGGMIYVSDPWGTPYKIDTTSGKRGDIVWICDTGIEKDPNGSALLANRGLALWNNLVITALSDGRVVACDSESGDVVWEQQTGSEPGEGFSGAPLVVKDKVLVGQSFGDWATRGWIAALDAKTGEEVWRFNVVPEPGQPGSETWLCDQTGNADCWKTGGGAVWQTGSYDPDSNTIYWGTGNPVPMYDPEYRPGDNLYTNSSVALDYDTGEMKWYFQYTPGDYMDYDEIGSQLLVNTQVDGQPRKVLAHFGRNGFFYTLDRSNGSFISATQYVDKLDWTSGIDPKTGKPLTYKAGSALQEYSPGSAPRRGGPETSACPHQQGGVNYFPTAYNPNTGVAFGGGIEGCTTFSAGDNDPSKVIPGQIFIGGDYASPGVIGGSMFSMDIATGKQIKKIDRSFPNWSGVMLTPDLVWTGETDGTFVAYDQKTLEEKFSINLGAGFKAPPMTFESNGKQYVAIMGGSHTEYGHPEIDNMQSANVIYFFSL